MNLQAVWLGSHPQLISTVIRFAQGLIVAAGPNVDSVVSGPPLGMAGRKIIPLEGCDIEI